MYATSVLMCCAAAAHCGVTYSPAAAATGPAAVGFCGAADAAAAAAATACGVAAALRRVGERRPLSQPQRLSSQHRVPGRGMIWKPAVNDHKSQHSGEICTCSCYGSGYVQAAGRSSRMVRSRWGAVCQTKCVHWNLHHGLSGTLHAISGLTTQSHLHPSGEGISLADVNHH